MAHRYYDPDQSDVIQFTHAHKHALSLPRPDLYHHITIVDWMSLRNADGMLSCTLRELQLYGSYYSSNDSEIYQPDYMSCVFLLSAVRS